MTERELQSAVLDTAALLGWHCFHARPARTAAGWRTAGEGNGAKGYPDLTLVHPRLRQVLFVELKTERGVLSDAQESWLEQLSSVACEHVAVHVWRPADWLSGRIEDALRGRPAAPP